VRGRAIGVAVREAGTTLYRHAATRRRVPASNQKLLLTMALLDRVGAEFSFTTSAAAAESPEDGVVDGDLWLLGRGDPTLSSERRYTRSLPVDTTKIKSLAGAVREAGITRIRGSVIGSTSYFARDWFAIGWKAGYPRDECPLPSALAINGNVNDGGNHVSDPEIRAARSLSQRLEKMGIRVSGPPGAAEEPPGLEEIASVLSEPLPSILQHLNVNSSNFFAEMLGKRLAVEARGRPGTIAKGAGAVEGWADRNGVTVIAHDASGLSYQNRVSPLGMVRLLGRVEHEEWIDPFRGTLARADEGTLENRLNGVRVRAKTGTLDKVSTLSGYVWLRSRDVWGEFSIMSSGMEKTTAADIENRIVRILTRSAG